jgi:type IV pilus assembly protein PilX
MTHSKLGHRQGGAILIVTLLFLVILTMLGVTAMTGTTMEERMAGNTRDAQLALQAAEAALRDARRDINNYTVKVGATFGRGIPLVEHDFYGMNSPGSCNPAKIGVCQPANNPNGTEYSRKAGTILPSVPATHSMSAAPSVEYGVITGAEPIGGAGVLAAQPRYLMEAFCARIHGAPLSAEIRCTLIRVTAAGYGRNPSTVVTLQEVFVRE